MGRKGDKERMKRNEDRNRDREERKEERDIVGKRGSMLYEG